MSNSCCFLHRMSLWVTGREADLVCSSWYSGSMALVPTKAWAQTKACSMSVKKRVPRMFTLDRWKSKPFREGRFPRPELSRTLRHLISATDLVYLGVGRHVPSFHSSEASEHRLGWRAAVHSSGTSPPTSKAGHKGLPSFQWPTPHTIQRPLTPSAAFRISWMFHGHCAAKWLDFVTGCLCLREHLKIIYVSRQN